ncbi:sugar transporter [Geobacter pickeringii]|uniref:Sugar transporter n=1 Tax=Geobacter pickeringii TaxID=345632 RepID=A0A0B5BL87_9BACT|nr:sugar transporter [Geobacter pickeringii]
MLSLLLGACASPPSRIPPVSARETGESPARGDYRIQAGDQLDIKFFYNPELNEQMTVRPDGKISLQLIHDTPAAGLTPAELMGRLAELYRKELKNPEVVVIVRSFSDQRVYVDGELNKPGVFPLVGSMTAMQAISQAGGLKETAGSAEVLVIRRGADNRPAIMTLNIDRVLDGTELSQDIVLHPYDIVYVPKSTIANVNQWVDQYLRRNIPLPLYLPLN